MFNEVGIRSGQTPAFMPVYYDDKKQKTEYVNINNIEAIHKFEDTPIPRWKIFYREIQEDGNYTVGDAFISDKDAKHLNIIA